MPSAENAVLSPENLYSGLDVESIPMISDKAIDEFGKTLVVAPHADDESLGCGGLIKLLTTRKISVSILLLTDGTLSHPNSRKFPAERLRLLRENELREAAEILGIARENIHFWRYQDRSLPSSESKTFPNVVKKCRALLDKSAVKTVFAPWRRDPHSDHRAAYEILQQAVSAEEIIEYAIWLYELAQTNDFPLPQEAIPFRIDISSVVESKIKAVSAHQSQIGNLIDDDPQGFRLAPSMLERFAAPFEIFWRKPTDS